MKAVVTSISRPSLQDAPVSAGSMSTTTDQEGQYVLAGVPPVINEVSVSREERHHYLESVLASVATKINIPVTSFSLSVLFISFLHLL